jgi:hypothetical protein
MVLPTLPKTLGLAAVCSVTLLLSFQGCVNNSPFASLRNEGVVPISANNPFVGGNLFLAREMEHSTYLYNFIKQRGAPQGIELMGDNDNSVEVKMLYAAQREVYFARPYLQKQGEQFHREWIIRGPYAVDRIDYRAVTSLPTEESAVFEMFGRMETFGRDSSVPVKSVILPAFVPTPLPTPRPKPKKPKVDAATAAAAAAGPTPTPTPESGPMNFDQKALVEARELAERNPNGDVIHNVKNPTETFHTLANWYAGDAEKAKEIADKNGLPIDAKLTPGTKLFVPADIVKNPKEMK